MSNNKNNNNKGKRHLTVFHVISHVELGGAERVAANIAASGNPDISYHIIEVARGRSPYSRQMAREMRQGGVRVHRSWMPDFHFHYLPQRLAAWSMAIRLPLLMLRHRPDVIHTHTEVPEMGCYLALASPPGRLLKRPMLVQTLHNTQRWTGMQGIGRRADRFFNAHGHVVAISQSVMQQYLTDCHWPGARQPVMIYNGVPEVPQRPYPGLVKGKTNILFAGRFDRQKGITQLVQTVTAMKDDDRYHFHIVGNGPLKSYIEQHLSHQSNVTMVPAVYQLSAQLASFDYFFMPSLFEGLSLMAIEASMAGLPIISSGCPGLKDTLPPHWPLTAPSNTVQSYVHMFCDVIPKLCRRQLSDMARQYVRQYFSVGQMQHAYETIYMQAPKP